MKNENKITLADYLKDNIKELLESMHPYIRDEKIKLLLIELYCNCVTKIFETRLAHLGKDEHDNPVR